MCLARVARLWTSTIEVHQHILYLVLFSRDVMMAILDSLDKLQKRKNSKVIALMRQADICPIKHIRKVQPKMDGSQTSAWLSLNRLRYMQWSALYAQVCIHAHPEPAEVILGHAEAIHQTSTTRIAKHTKHQATTGSNTIQHTAH